MVSVNIRRCVWRAFGPVVVIFTALAGVARAQASCDAAIPRSVGLALGRSAAYFELERDFVATNASVTVRSGPKFAGRTDLPIGGPWRMRVEASVANWRLEAVRYNPASTQDFGRAKARELVALVGRQGGSRGLCGYVLGGIGLYSISFERVRVRRPGGGLTAGMEIPTRRGAVQLEMQMRLIDTPASRPLASTAVLTAALTAGWALRF